MAVTSSKLNPRIYYIAGTSDKAVYELAWVHNQWLVDDIIASTDIESTIAWPLSATKADGGHMTAKLASNVIHGDLDFYGDGSFLYYPESNYIGLDSFTYLANDSMVDSAPVTVELNVTNPCAPVDGNVVANFCFVDGETPWRFYHNEGQGSYALSADNPLVGEYAAEITINTSGNNVQFYQKGIRLQPNTTYELSFAARSNDGQDMTVHVHNHRAPYESYGLAGYHANLESYWKQFTVTFTTGDIPNWNNTRLRFWLKPYAQAGTVYHVDKVVLRPLSNP
jgi:hypothetical protein